MGVIKLENQRGNNSQKNILKLSRNHFIMPHYQKNMSMHPAINITFALHWRLSLDMTYNILVSYQKCRTHIIHRTRYTTGLLSL